MNLGRLMGVGRWGLVLGAVGVGFGTGINNGTMVWGGVAVAALALTVNTIGKLAQYASLDVPVGQRLAVGGAWLFLASTVGALVVDYALAWARTGYESYFWSLLIGVAGFTAIYVGLRLKYVPGAGADAEETGESPENGDERTGDVA